MKTTSSEHVVYIIFFLSLFWHSKQFMYTTCSDLAVFMYWTGKSMNNLLSCCGLVDARVRAFNKFLPVQCTRSCMDLQNRNPTQPRIKQEGQNFLREPALISRVSSPFSPSFVATFYMESYSGWNRQRQAKSSIVGPNSKNPPKMGFKNLWNWLVILVTASIWQLLNIRLVQWPENLVGNIPEITSKELILGGF